MLVSPCHKRPLYKKEFFNPVAIIYYCNLCDRGYDKEELVNVNEIN